MSSLITAYLLVAAVLLIRGAVMARRNPEMVRNLSRPWHVLAFVVLTSLWIVMIPLSVLLGDGKSREREDES